MKKNLLLVALPILVLASCGETSGSGGGSGGGGGGGSCDTPITAAQASAVAAEINAYLSANPITKLQVTIKDDTSTLALYQFNQETLYSYQWSVENYGDGDYTFVEGKTGYYYYERQPGSDPDHPDTTKFYIQYNNVDEVAYGYESSYQINSLAVRSYASVTIEPSGIEESPYTTFYSCGAGNLVIVVDLSSVGYGKTYTEYRDYKPYKMPNLSGDGTAYYEYSFVEDKPADRGSYYKYGEY